MCSEFCPQNHILRVNLELRTLNPEHKCIIMKKLTFTIVFILSQVLLFAQTEDSCLPNGITFETQADIDNFQTDYPNCTEIEGNVQIEGDEITNLNGLSVLTNIGGRLRFYTCTVLPDLTGLENLTTIGGDLIIYVWPSSTTSLTTLSGLDNLVTVGGALEVTGTDVLLNLAGLENLTTIGENFEIGGNTSMINLLGLDNLTSIGGDIWIGENPVLTLLSGLESLTSIEGSFEIYESDALVNFTGLNNLNTIGGDFKVNYNNSLSSFSGLESLTSIGGYVEVYYNNVLTELTGLGNIDAGSITDIYVEENPMLSTCHVMSICNYLSAPNGDTEISNNASGCNTPEEVEEACLEISLNEFYGNNEISIFPNPTNDLAFLSLNTPVKKFSGDLHLQYHRHLSQKAGNSNINSLVKKSLRLF